MCLQEEAENPSTDNGWGQAEHQCSVPAAHAKAGAPRSTRGMWSCMYLGGLQPTQPSCHTWASQGHGSNHPAHLLKFKAECNYTVLQSSPKLSGCITGKYVLTSRSKKNMEWFWKRTLVGFEALSPFKYTLSGSNFYFLGEDCLIIWVSVDI